MSTNDPERRREWQRQWRAKNREKLNAKQKEWYAKPENRERRRRYVAANRERFNASRRARDAANRDEVTAKRRARYAAEGGALTKHGLDVAAWAAMWEAQHGCCYLCGEPMVAKDSVIEHDHRCCGPFKSCRVCRRGIAHQSCNRLIGHAGDDPALLRRIADALEVAMKGVDERRAALGHEQLTLEIP